MIDMEYAIVDGKRCQPFQQGQGRCPKCGCEMTVQSFNAETLYWRHPLRRCGPWGESETLWHRQWKSQFPPTRQEACYVDDNGVAHWDDIRTTAGLVVKLHVGTPTIANRQSREAFCENLVWLVNGERFADNFHIHHKLPDPTSELGQDLVWDQAGTQLVTANTGIFRRLSECRLEHPSTKSLPR
jgi:competence protein CoiA